MLQKIIKNLRLVLLFLGYLFSIYMLNFFEVIKQVKISDENIILVIGIGGVILVLMSIILDYFGKNINSIYYLVYASVVGLILLNSNIKSEYSFFCMVIALVVLSIFCQYLFIFENKIANVLYKGADMKELQNSYARYILALVGLMVIVFGLIIGGYKTIQIISSSIIMHMYSENVFFSIPAIGGFISIALICIFFIILLYEKKED